LSPGDGGRFYVLSRGRRERLELAEELMGDVALQASLDLADALAFGETSLHVGLHMQMFGTCGGSFDSPP
jgi:hypothetical protein